MAFARGPYAEQATLPSPATTKLVGSESVNFGTGRYELDSDGNNLPMRETAQRVQTLLSFAIYEPTGFLDTRSLNRLKQRGQEALAELVNEGTIRNVRILVNPVGAGRSRVEAKYYDVLRSTDVSLTVSGPKWSDVSWTAAAPTADGTLTLTSWLTHECATAQTSAQTSASSVETGFAANAARGFSRDGVAWGLLNEVDATNLSQPAPVEDWTQFGGFPLTFNAATTPAGTTEGCEAEDDSASAESQVSIVGSIEGSWNVSGWAQKLGATGTSQFLLRDQLAGVNHATVSFSSEDDDWTYRNATASIASATSAGTTASDGTFVRITPRSSGADTGSCRYWGMQLEARSYPTSFIGADNATFTRAASYTKALASAVAPSGWFDLTVTYAPLYAYDEVTGEHDVIHIDADNRVYYDGSDDSYHFVLHGTEVAAAGAVTFSRDQALTVRARHLPTGVTLTVSGATTGDGSDTSADEPRVAPAKFVHILGGASGAQEGAALQSIVSTAS
jgi:hypothetical protein